MMTTYTRQPPTDDKVLEALRAVYDPEIGMNIVDLGLVYVASRTPEAIHVEFTTTSPACPMGEAMTREAQDVLKTHFPDHKSIHVELVFDPPWTPDLMSEAGRKQLGLS